MEPNVNWGRSEFIEPPSNMEPAGGINPISNPDGGDLGSSSVSLGGAPHCKYGPAGTHNPTPAMPGA